MEVKAQKKRVKKDKDAPKKPMPPFFCYQKSRRDNLKKEVPTADNTQLIKVSLTSSAIERARSGLWASGGRDISFGVPANPLSSVQICQFDFDLVLT